MKYILLFLICNITLYAQNGDLDNSFGVNGKVITDLGARDLGFSSAIQNDGKIVVAGTTGNSSDFDFVLVRYNSDGSLDSTFGTLGKVITPIGNTWSSARSIAIQSDGKIVVAGYFLANAFTDFVVVRYNSDGSLDNTFDLNGIVPLSLSNADDQAFSVAIQNDGKIIVAGQSDVEEENKFSLVRLNNDGSLDNAFGIGGVLISPIGGGYMFETDITILSDGKILMTGKSQYNVFTLMKIKDDGTLDNSFGLNGAVYTSFGNYAAYSRSIAVQIDGKIIVAGNLYDGMGGELALARYHADGRIDSAFGVNGKVMKEFDSLSSLGNSVVIQTDGKIIVSGFTYNASYSAALFRYNSDGSLDYNFGVNGLVETNFNNINGVGYSCVLQNDGKIILVGSATDGSNSDVALARFNSSTTGITDKIKSSDITIYPNPTSGILTLKTNHNCEVRVFDVLGKCIVTKHISSNINATLDLSSQKKGMYFIELVSENAKTIRKVVLE